MAGRPKSRISKKSKMIELVRFLSAMEHSFLLGLRHRIPERSTEWMSAFEQLATIIHWMEDKAWEESNAQTPPVERPTAEK